MSIALSNGVSRLSIREMSFKQWRQRTAESGKMQLSSPPSLISYLHCKEIYILGAFRGHYQRHLCYWERLSAEPISLGGNEPVGRWWRGNTFCRSKAPWKGYNYIGQRSRNLRFAWEPLLKEGAKMERATCTPSKTMGRNAPFSKQRKREERAGVGVKAASPCYLIYF